MPRRDAELTAAPGRDDGDRTRRRLAEAAGRALPRGETLVEIESDKTVVEMPALGRRRARPRSWSPAGSDIDVGARAVPLDDGATRPVRSGPDRRSGRATRRDPRERRRRERSAASSGPRAAGRGGARLRGASPPHRADAGRRSVARRAIAARPPRDAHAGRAARDPAGTGRAAASRRRSCGCPCRVPAGAAASNCATSARGPPRPGDRALIGHDWEAQGRVGRGAIGAAARVRRRTCQTWAALAAALSRRGIRVVTAGPARSRRDGAGGRRTDRR